MNEWDLENADPRQQAGARHHTVPAFYLRRFANSQNQLWVRDRRSPVPGLRKETDLAIRDFYAIKKSMLGRRVLRSKTWAGIAQEVYALPSAYQVLRTAIADATGTTPGADPDRGSFSVALRCARDQVVQAAGIIADTVIDLVGTIGRAVLDQLMPARRLRISPRAVKRPLSRYAYKSLKVDRRTYTATLSINILTPTISP